MKRTIKVLFYYILVALSTTELSAIHENIGTKQAEVLAQDADRLFRKSLKDDDNASLKASFEKISKAIELDPTNLRMLFFYYHVGYANVEKRKEQSIIPNLKKIYPTLKNAGLDTIPPASLDLLLVDKDDNKTKLKLLRRAISENKTYAYSYFLLSDIYSHDNLYEMSIDILTRGLKNNPSQADDFHYFLALTYSDKLYHLENILECGTLDIDLIKHIISEAKATLKINPKKYVMYSLLEISYNMLGQFELALESSRTDYQKSKENNESEDASSSYQYSLLRNLNKNKFFQLLNSKEINSTDETLADAYFYSQEWAKASQKYEKLYLKKDNTYFYGHLRLASTKEKAGDKVGSIKIMTNLSDKTLNKPWKKLLAEHFLRRIEDGELIRNADNKCKKTEAYFWVGMKYLKNDKEKAREYFKKVLDEKIYSYREYTASWYFLNEGIK